MINPVDGEPIVAHDRRLTSRNNVLAVEEVPLFYWPTFSTNLEDPTFYFERIIFKQDSVFGTQIFTDINMFELLGIENPPAGVNWDISLDYLSLRGPGLGTTFTWDRQDVFGVLQGPNFGVLDAWGIHDDGFDNLGRDFRHIEVPDKLRGRVFGRHRQYFQDGYQVTAEIGYISDRNFLEEYFENEWDEFKDQTTGLEFKRYLDNSSWAISVDGRLNPFFTQTQQLPRGDHFLLGQSLLQDRLTWFEHTSAMYAKFQTANAPTDPTQASQWGPLPWAVPGEGDRLATRHEIDMPFTIGGLKVVPYALGEAAHWGETISGDDVTRLYGQVGVRLVHLSGRSVQRLKTIYSICTASRTKLCSTSMRVTPMQTRTLKTFSFTTRSMTMTLKPSAIDFRSLILADRLRYHYGSTSAIGPFEAALPAT